GNGIAVTTADGTLEYCNAALLQLMAQGPKTLLGSSIFELLDGGANGELQGLYRNALATNSELRTRVHNSGVGFAANAVLCPVNRPDGQRVIWSFIEVRRVE